MKVRVLLPKMILGLLYLPSERMQMTMEFLIPVEGIVQTPANEQANPDRLGRVYLTVNEDDTTAPNGLLQLKVHAAQDGHGTVDLDIVRTNAPEQKYDGAETATRQVHAGDDKTHLLITYTATQTIERWEAEIHRSW